MDEGDNAGERLPPQYGAVQPPVGEDEDDGVQPQETTATADAADAAPKPKKVAKKKKAAATKKKTDNVGSSLDVDDAIRSNGRLSSNDGAEPGARSSNSLVSEGKRRKSRAGDRTSIAADSDTSSVKASSVTDKKRRAKSPAAAAAVEEHEEAPSTPVQEMDPNKYIEGMSAADRRIAEAQGSSLSPAPALSEGSPRPSFNSNRRAAARFGEMGAAPIVIQPPSTDDLTATAVAPAKAETVNAGSYAVDDSMAEKGTSEDDSAGKLNEAAEAGDATEQQMTEDDDVKQVIIDDEVKHLKKWNVTRVLFFIVFVVLSGYDVATDLLFFSATKVYIDDTNAFLKRQSDSIAAGNLTITPATNYFANDCNSSLAATGQYSFNCIMGATDCIQELTVLVANYNTTAVSPYATDVSFWNYYDGFQNGTCNYVQLGPQSSFEEKLYQISVANGFVIFFGIVSAFIYLFAIYFNFKNRNWGVKSTVLSIILFVIQDLPQMAIQIRLFSTRTSISCWKCVVQTGCAACSTISPVVDVSSAFAGVADSNSVIQALDVLFANPVILLYLSLAAIVLTTFRLVLRLAGYTKCNKWQLMYMLSIPLVMMSFWVPFLWTMYVSLVPVLGLTNTDADKALLIIAIIASVTAPFMWILSYQQFRINYLSTIELLRQQILERRRAAAIRMEVIRQRELAAAQPETPGGTKAKTTRITIVNKSVVQQQQPQSPDDNKRHTRSRSRQSDTNGDEPATPATITTPAGTSARPPPSPNVQRNFVDIDVAGRVATGANAERIQRGNVRSGITGKTIGK